MSCTYCGKPAVGMVCTEWSSAFKHGTCYEFRCAEHLDDHLPPRYPRNEVEKRAKKK